MWKDFWKSLITLFTLAKELERNRKDVEELRKDLTDIADAHKRLADEIKIQKLEDANEREKMVILLQSEREKMVMQIQIEILKLQNRLQLIKPDAGKDTTDDEKDN